MKILFYLSLILFFFLLVSKTSFSLKPFSITIAEPFYGLGLFFLFISLFCFDLNSKKKGFEEGVNYTKEIAIDSIMELKQKINSEEKKEADKALKELAKEIKKEQNGRN